MTLDPRSFLATVAGYTAAQTATDSANRPVRLATVDPDYTGTGAPRVTFDGESTLSSKLYAFVDSYRPTAGERVVLVPVGTTYVIIGHIATGTTYPLRSDTPLCAVRQGTTGTTLSTGVASPLLFDTDDADPGGFHSTTVNTSRVTPTVPGVYMTAGKVAFGDSSGSGRRGSIIRKNGTDDLDQVILPAGGNTNAKYVPVANTFVSCDGSTDYVELLGFQDSGGAASTIPSTDETATMFRVVFVRGL